MFEIDWERGYFKENVICDINSTRNTAYIFFIQNVLTYVKSSQNIWRYKTFGIDPILEELINCQQFLLPFIRNNKWNKIGKKQLLEINIYKK